MRFQVPQFIDVEDKVFGPLTIKQFVYLAGGAALCYLAYAFLPSLIAFLVIPVVLVFTGSLAFYKINNKPFISIVEASLRYTLSNKLYIWRKEAQKIEQKSTQEKGKEPLVYLPKLSQNKLKDLAWSLDINEKISKTVFSPETGQLEARQNHGFRF